VELAEALTIHTNTLIFVDRFDVVRTLTANVQSRIEESGVAA
jgi:hypothetical protein